MTVLITTPSFGAQSDRPWRALEAAGLEARRPAASHPLSSAQLVAEVGDATAVIVGLDTVDRSFFANAPGVRVVAKHGVGVDNIDLDAAREAGVRVVNAPGSNSGAVADLTWALMLALARKVVPAHGSMLENRWDRFSGTELAGRTLGVLGFGRIGQAVARRAAGFDLHVVAYDPYVPDEVFAERGVRRVEFAEAVASADFLSLHLPGAPGAAALLGAAELATLPHGAFLVNAARGGLVDEDALVTMLHDGRLGGAALDAFEHEPLPADSPLLTAPNVILTPHIGAFTDVANAAMGEIAVEDVRRILNGEEPLNPVV